VTYEAEQGGDKFWVFGADGKVKPHKRVEVGGTLARDENPFGRYDLGSVNTTLDLGVNSFLIGEFAHSDSAGITTGDAARVEVRHTSARYSGRVFYLNTDESFYNPSSRFGRGRREFGFRGSVILDEMTRVVAEGLRSDNRSNGGHRRGFRLGVARRLNAWIGAHLGYRRSKETSAAASALTSGATPNETNTLITSLSGTLPDLPNASVMAEYEQDLSEWEQRRILVGGDYRLFDRARVYARHEFISSLAGPYALNTTQEQNITLFGVSADYLKNSQIFTEYRARDAFAGREAHAAIGLRNQWSLGQGIRLSTSLERLSPLSNTEGKATSVTGAIEYTRSQLWKAHARFEVRSNSSGEHVFGSLGYAQKINRDLTFLGHTVVSHIIDGPVYERSRLGFAYRETDKNRWNALVRYENKYERNPGLTDSRRMAHIFSGHVNYHTTDQLTLRRQLANKLANNRSEVATTHDQATLIGLRGTYDVTPVIDVGASFRSLFSRGMDSHQFGVGGELGYLLKRNMRLAVGYNVFGFRDDDIASDEYTDHGFYIDFGFKFDEDLFKRGQSE
jgi:hypothetical protein